MAMFFPIIPEAIPAQAAAEIGRVPAFDMEARRFLLVDGKLVERTGQEAVRQWFELALRQQPDRVPIYRTSGEKRYGIDRGVLETKLPSGYAGGGAGAQRAGDRQLLPSGAGSPGSRHLPAGEGPAWWNLRRYCIRERQWR